MRALLLPLTLLITFIAMTSSYALEAISFEDISAIEEKGQTLILGEVTGVGKSIPIEQVDSFITEGGQIQMTKVLKVIFTAETTLTVNNITQLVLKDKIIPRDQLKGLILK